MLSDELRKQLLTIARAAIEGAFGGGFDPPDAAQVDQALREPAGAFVTLNTRGGDLRGCIGSIVAREPLYRAVFSSALNAAFHDPRFPPVEREELESLHIEVSVMGPIEPVTDINEIVVG